MNWIHDQNIKAKQKKKKEIICNEKKNQNKS